MAFKRFLTSAVSKICCFSEIVAVRCDAILSAIWDGSFNCLIVFITSLEIYLSEQKFPGSNENQETKAMTV